MKTYKVIKIFRVSGKRKVLRKGLTIEEAKHIVRSYPDSQRSMVVFTEEN